MEAAIIDHNNQGIHSLVKFKLKVNREGIEYYLKIDMSYAMCGTVTLLKKLCKVESEKLERILFLLLQLKREKSLYDIA